MGKKGSYLSKQRGSGVVGDLAELPKSSGFQGDPIQKDSLVLTQSPPPKKCKHLLGPVRFSLSLLMPRGAQEAALLWRKDTYPERLGEPLEGLYHHCRASPGLGPGTL